MFSFLSSSKKEKCPIRSIDHNIVFLDDEVFAFYRLDNVPFDFTNAETQSRSFELLSNLLTNVMGDRERPLNYELWVTSDPLDLNAWRERVTKQHEKWSPDQEPLMRYFERTMPYLEAEGAEQKRVYLGLSLGDRVSINWAKANPFVAGFKSAIKEVGRFIASVFETPGEDLSDEELETARGREVIFFDIVQSSELRPVRVTTLELALLYKRRFYPSMPIPFLTIDPGTRIGRGHLETEGYKTGQMKEEYDHIKAIREINGVEYTGYQTTIAMYEFPRETTYPGAMPYYFFFERYGFPFTGYIKGTLTSASSEKRKLNLKKTVIEDEVRNLGESQDDTSALIQGVPVHIQRNLEDIDVIEGRLVDSNAPWSISGFRIIVESSDLDELRSFVHEIKTKYSDSLNIGVIAPHGDQMEFFREQFPGAKKLVNDYDQRCSVELIAGSGLNFANEVGDLTF